MTHSVLALNGTYPAHSLGFCPLADAPAQWSLASLYSFASDSLASGATALSQTLDWGVSKANQATRALFHSGMQKPCNWPKTGNWKDWKTEEEFDNAKCWYEFKKWSKIERISDFIIYSGRQIDYLKEGVFNKRVDYKYINGYFQITNNYEDKEIYGTRYTNREGKIYFAAVLTQKEYQEEQAKCEKNDEMFAEEFKNRAPEYYYSKHEHLIKDEFYTDIKSRWGNQPQACKFEALRRYYGFSLELPRLPDLVYPRKYPLDEPELSRPNVEIKPYVEQLNRWYDQYQANMAQAQERLDAKGLPGWDEFEAFQLDGHLAYAWEKFQSYYPYLDSMGMRNGVSYSVGDELSTDPCWNLPQDQQASVRFDREEDSWNWKILREKWAEYLKHRSYKNEGFEYRGAWIPCFTKDSADRVPSVETLVRWRLEDYNIWKAFREKVQDVARTNGTKIVEDFEKCLIEKNDKIYQNIRYKNHEGSLKPADLIFSKWKEEFDKFYFDNFVLEETESFLRLAKGENGYSRCYDSKPKPPIPSPLPEPKPPIPAPPDDSNLAGRVALGALVTGAVGAAAYALWPKRPKAPTPQPEETDDIEGLSPRPASARAYSERFKTSAEKRRTSSFDLQEPHSPSQSLDQQQSTAGIQRTKTQQSQGMIARVRSAVSFWRTKTASNE